MNVYEERAETLQKQGYNCCQCLVGCLCEEFGIDRATAFRFAGAFGSGIACTGEVCGAVTGAMMLIGLKCNSKQLPEQEYDETIDELAWKYIERFKEVNNGSYLCRELLGEDPGTDEGWQRIMDNDMHNKICRKIIVKGAEIISELLLDEER